jgi:hypothetical protein
MIKVTIIADDYYVAQNHYDIASMVENNDILDEVYDGKKNKIEIEEYNCTIERVYETDKPTYTCPHCGETLEQGDYALTFRYLTIRKKPPWLCISPKVRKSGSVCVA